MKKTLKVEKQSVSLKENGIQLNLTVIDTPGFGDSVRISSLNEDDHRPQSPDKIYILGK